MYDQPQKTSPLLVIAETDWRGVHRRFGILEEDRLRHLWVVGKTGTGKSTLLLNLLSQDLKAGRGVGLLDPHGDLATAALGLVPQERRGSVCWFDPADSEAAVAFNVLRQGGQSADPTLISSSILSAFRKHWADVWGPRLEHILRNAVLAVAPDPRATLLSLYRFLTDEGLRRRLAPRIEDPVVRQFWVREFPGYRAALQAEALSPVLNKLGSFVANRQVRRIVAQQRSRLDIGALMAERGVLLCNLSVGRVGEDASRLLGSLLVSSIQLAAMRRPGGRPPFYLYIDEFQHFVTDALATVLSEARKFGLALTLSHQYLSQVPAGLLDAMRGNVGSAIILRVGAADASVLACDVAPEFSAHDLAALPSGRAVVRVVARGEATPPFSARLLPPPEAPPSAPAAQRIIEASRQRFSTPVSAVDAVVERTLAD